MLKPHKTTIFDLVNYLLQWFTIKKKPFIFILILTCPGGLNVLCLPQFQFGVSLLGELTFIFLIKETDWYLILSASVCLKSFYFSIFEHYFTVYRFWGMRGFVFFFLSAFETNLLARLVSDETAAIVLTFVSLFVKLSLFSGLSWQCQPPLDCPEWSHTSRHLNHSLPPWSTAAQLDLHPLLLEHMLLPLVVWLLLPPFRQLLECSILSHMCRKMWPRPQVDPVMGSEGCLPTTLQPGLLDGFLTFSFSPSCVFLLHPNFVIFK